MAGGSPLVATGPDSSAGAVDNKWHMRLGVENNGTVLTSAGLNVSAEDAPALRAKINFPKDGAYDI